MRQPLENWLAQSVRVTAFPVSGFEIPEVSWWTTLVAEPPETRTMKPREGILFEEGIVQEGRLRLKIHPIKIDWHYVVARPEKVEQGIPSLGTFSQTLELFVPLMRRWLKDMCPKINRLAFGASIFQPVQDQKTGYETLGRYLPAVKIDPIGSSDFLYRINRPRQLKTGMPGLKINRLTSWSVIRLESHSAVAQRLFVQDLNLRACYVELDISTSQDHEGDLPSDKLTGIFDELLSESKELATEGDIP